MDRQHVEILVGKNDRRTAGNIVERSCQAILRTPVSVDFCFSRSTGLISTRWTLSDDRAAATPQRAQRIRHHGAAAGPSSITRSTEGEPIASIRRRPQPEQFAEHLADFGRGGEIALASSGSRAT